MVLVFAIDITERKKLEEQFLRAQRMESIGMLASGIAHDLNNVLCPILMSTQLLEELAEDPTNKALLSSMGKSARRGTDIIRQVLTFARGMEGGRSPIQLRYIVEEIVEMASETFPRNISVCSSHTDGLQIVVGDSTQLHQAILNLCVNARDAMPKGGTLRLDLDEVEVDAPDAATMIGAIPGRYVRLSVADTGEGISQEIRERIFEPFFTTKAQGKGTGLGLATALGIVQSHKGFIGVQSQAGTGTTFRVHLPVCAEALAAPTSEPALEDLRGHGEGILLVDDEEEVRAVATQVLERAGYRSYVAADGVDALGCLAKHEGKIDLVVTDLMMPMMDGLFLIQAARRHYPKLPFVVASGLAESECHAEEIAALKAMEVTEILVKPFSASGLLLAVRNALRA